MRLNLRAYLWYKLLNSLFFGLSVGSVFVLYAPLQPSIYSLGGVLLAVGLLVVAKFYEAMMHMQIFFIISLFVELIVLVFVAFFLVVNYDFMSALVVYIGYQFTFLFGNYLVRMETLVLKKATLLSFVDIAKQKGYLIGMLISYGFYKLLENLHVSDKQTQVYDLHVGLFVLQLCIIYALLKAFRKDMIKSNI
ncbi:MAG: hypothetical protein IBX44_08315 [Sulfurospirillum sp.]|nr:hypothetical protein [Sulfurospirillum sp.]